MLPQAAGTTRVAATGDSILTRRLSAIQRPEFLELVGLLRGADVAFTNLEMVFPGPDRQPGATYHGTHLGVDPELLDEFGWLGFDVYGMANNHATDYGTNGLTASLAELSSRGMLFAGAGQTLREARRPVYLQTPSARVALIAATSSNARLSVAADPGDGDRGRPGVAPVRVGKTYFIREDHFGDLRSIIAETGLDVKATGTTAPGIFLPYPDRNIWDAPPPGGFAVESVHFAPDETSHITTTARQRDIDALTDVVDEARRQADLVFVALHCHEGDGGRWNTETPAEFLAPLAHALIDAGAHAIFGSGPHMLRGVEIYRGRPICYSLGNFIFTLETIGAFPVEVYEQLGLPPTSSAADLYDEITGYATERRFWETVVPSFDFAADGRLVSAELVPVTLGHGQPRARRGCPGLASESDGHAILERLAALSKPFGTHLEITSAGGRVSGRIAVS
jgi:poly-gamma-glutamate capsule biosynthesis protein CapA/YwtB (metallophosphatase superfamily)